MVQCVQHFQKMPHAASEAISRPNHQNVELSPVSGGEHLVERRALRLGAADPVGVFVDDFRSRAVPARRRRSSACVSGF
jgi:hypothetical protein